MCAAAADASARTIEIPALAFGTNQWSVVKLTNPSAEAHRVTLEVYRQNGERMPFEGNLNLNPRESVELRIEGRTDKFREMCWARIFDVSGDIEATAVIEILKGDTIESFDRPPKEPSRATSWIVPSWTVQDKDLYFLNASDKPVEVSFCTTSSRFTGACPKRGVAHYPMQPNQSVLVGIRKLHQQYFLTTSSTRGRAVVVLMTPGMGDRKMFSSDSSIQFGDPGER